MVIIEWDFNSATIASHANYSDFIILVRGTWLRTKENERAADRLTNQRVGRLKMPNQAAHWGKSSDRWQSLAAVSTSHLRPQVSAVVKGTQPTLKYMYRALIKDYSGRSHWLIDGEGTKSSRCETDYFVMSLLKPHQVTYPASTCSHWQLPLAAPFSPEHFTRIILQLWH